MEKSFSKEAAWLLAAALFPAAVYLYSLGNSFAFDDKHIIASNKFLDDLANIRFIFSSRYFELSGELSYRPVITISYFFDRALWGLSPFGYRLTNLVFHAGAALFFYRFLLRLLSSRPWSLLSSLAFSLHPAVSEAVLSPGFRDDIISGFFFILALTLFFCPARYLKNASKSDRPRPLFLAFSAISFFIALFSKESAAVLLPILMSIDFINRKERLGAFLKRFSFDYWYFVAVLAFYLAVRFIFMHNPLESKLIYAAGGFLSALYTAPRLIFFYLITFVLPGPLRVDYDFRPSHSPLDPAGMTAALALTVFSVFIYRRRRASSDTLIAAIWFFLTISPVLGLIPISNLVADRFLYLPAMGLSIGFSAALMKLTRGNSGCTGRPQAGKVALVLLGLVLFFFSAATVKRGLVWRNDVSLWADASLKSPKRTRPLLNLGTALMERGEVDKAMASYIKAITLEPEADSYTNLGSAFKKRNLAAKAMWAYGEALAITPGYFEASYNLGLLAVDKGDYRSAYKYFLQASITRPRDADTRNILGASFSEAGLKDKAAAEYKAALHIEPLYDKALSNLARFYLSKGLNHKAVPAYKSLISLDKDNSSAQQSLGVAYQRLGLSDKAAAQFRLVLASKADFEAFFNLGALYSQKKLFGRAIELYSEALKIGPERVDAIFNLGASYHVLGRKDKARTAYLEVLHRLPSFEPALENLAIISGR